MKHHNIAAFALSIALLISLMVASLAVAQAPLPGGTYSQDFDTLANTGTTNTVVPSGWAFLETGTNANTTYAAGTGSSNTGNTYSFGPTGNSDRAFGELSSGTLVSTLGVQFQNQTGSTIGRLVIQYTCEQWRDGDSTADALTFQYSTDATALNTGIWTSVTALDCNSVVATGANGALDGNLLANQTTISVTISGLNIENNSTFWLRWSGSNATGNDDALALDNFTLQMLTPTAITLQTFEAHSASRSFAILAFISSLLVVSSLRLLRRRSRAA